MIKGIIQQNRSQNTAQQSPDLGFGMAEMINKFRKEISSLIDEKMGELDTVIQDIKSSGDENGKKVDQKLADFEKTAVGMIQEIKNLPQIRGNDGDSPDPKEIAKNIMSKFPNEDRLTQNILSKVPKFDENKLLTRFKKYIPAQRQPDVTIIRERVEIDPLSVIDSIMKLPKGKFKLKTENIDGLDQTISAFNNQLGRGYLHGGGDTVIAGTNVTITTNAAGKKVISSVGGSGSTIYNDTVSGTIDSSNKIFTVSHTINFPIALYLANSVYQSGVDYTFSGTTITFVIAPDSSLSGQPFWLAHV